MKGRDLLRTRGRAVLLVHPPSSMSWGAIFIYLFFWCYWSSSIISLFNPVMFTFTLRLQVRPREAASGACCQRMQSKFILLLPTKYLPKMNILRSFLHPPPHHRFWKSYNCALMPFLIYPLSKIRECEKSQLHVNAFSSIAPQYLTPMCQHPRYVFSIQRYLKEWRFDLQKMCQSNS